MDVEANQASTRGFCELKEKNELEPGRGNDGNGVYFEKNENGVLMIINIHFNRHQMRKEVGLEA